MYLSRTSWANLTNRGTHLLSNPLQPESTQSWYTQWKREGKLFYWADLALQRCHLGSLILRVSDVQWYIYNLTARLFSLKFQFGVMSQMSLALDGPDAGGCFRSGAQHGNTAYIRYITPWRSHSRRYVYPKPFSFSGFKGIYVANSFGYPINLSRSNDSSTLCLKQCRLHRHTVLLLPVLWCSSSSVLLRMILQAEDLLLLATLMLYKIFSSVS